MNFVTCAAAEMNPTGWKEEAGQYQICWSTVSQPFFCICSVSPIVEKYTIIKIVNKFIQLFSHSVIKLSY